MMRPVLHVMMIGLLGACGGQATADDDGDGGDVDPDAGPDGGGPVDGDADYLFDLTRLHTFALEVAPADWAWLEANALLEEYRPAAVVFEGERWEGAAVRFKGGFGTLESCFDEAGDQICPKLSLKVKFNEYDPAGRFYGLRKLDFHSSVRDDTLLHEVVSYHLFRSLGVPAPRASHALVTVNGEPQGLFVLVEEVDKEFIQDHWGSADAGNLYKSVWPQYAEAEPYQVALETNETTGDVSRMIALYQAVEQATDDSFAAEMVARLDLPAVARYLAVDRAIGNDDGVKQFYCYVPGATAADCENENYYWYEVPGGPSQLIAWDTDYTLGEVNADLARSHWEDNPGGCQPIPFCDYWNQDPCDVNDVWLLPPQCNRLYRLLHRTTWNDYRAALRQLADGALARAQVEPLMAGLRDKLRPEVAADPYGPGLVRWEESVAWLDEVLVGQLAEVERLLAEPPQ